ncbi:MAG: 7-cyano-7-deazaguanine synthase [Thermoplasmata archaeon]
MATRRDKGILVPLLSGGLDSAIATAKAREVFATGRIEPIFVSWGQSSIEAEHAAFDGVCEALHIEPSMRHYFTIGKEWRIPRGWKEPKLPFPFARNLLLLSLASASAATIFAGSEPVVITGFTKDDAATDAQGGFVDSFNSTLESAVQGNIDLKRVSAAAPLREMTKSEAIRWASENRLGELMAATWSCWESGKSPCDECEPCRKRSAAFREAGIPDPAKA